jgi:rhamnogalacturonan hydrolase
MYLLKSNGGSGTVSNVLLENFIGTYSIPPFSRSRLTNTGHGNAYSLDIDQAWSSMSTVSGDGVQLENVTISNWKGTLANGAERGPIKVNCASKAPCYDMTIEDFDMWTEEGSYQWHLCENAYGSGKCLRSGDDYTPYTVTKTVTAATGYEAATMAADLATAFGTDMPIAIPAIPTSFYPGATPYSSLASAQTTSA